MRFQLAVLAGALVLGSPATALAAGPVPGPAALGGYPGCLVVQEAGAKAPLLRVGDQCAERVSTCPTAGSGSAAPQPEEKTSPDEQVAVLDRLRGLSSPEFPVQGAQAPGVYRGRSATCPRSGAEPGLGWWTGWVERDGRATTFAMLVRGEGATGATARRLAEAELLRLGLLATEPEPAAPRDAVTAAAAPPPPPPLPPLSPWTLVFDFGWDWGQQSIAIVYFSTHEESMDANDGPWLALGAGLLRFRVGGAARHVVLDTLVELGVKKNRATAGDDEVVYTAIPLVLQERLTYRSIRFGAGVDHPLLARIDYSGPNLGKRRTTLDRGTGLLVTVEYVGHRLLGATAGVRVLRQSFRMEGGGTLGANALGFVLRWEL
ncbi:MAG: hypothetical protein U0229_09290 [Anaeromyxobacter sp.]